MASAGRAEACCQLVVEPFADQGGRDMGHGVDVKCDEPGWDLCISSDGCPFLAAKDQHVISKKTRRCIESPQHGT